MTIRNSADTGQDESIRANNFGGLNTEASPLNIAYSESPKLVNVDITEGQSIVKRRGTVQVDSTVGPRSSIYNIPVESSSGYSYLLSKRGTSLVVQEMINDAPTTRITRNNVWNAASTNAKMDGTLTQGQPQRAIFVCQTNAPIQVHILEQRAQFNGGITGTTNFFDSERKFQYATANNTLVYVNGVYQPSIVPSWSANTLTLSSFTFPSGAVTVDVVTFIWQWWAEAIAYFGNRVCEQVTRFNAIPTDVHVPIPNTLRDDARGFDTTWQYGMFVSNETDGINVLNSSFEAKPTTANIWYASNGLGATFASATQRPQRGSTHITFGALEAASAVTPLMLLRVRSTKLRANLGVQPQNLGVFTTRDFVAGTINVLPQYTGSVHVNSYAYTLYSNPSTILTNVTAAFGVDLLFIGGSRKGVPTSDVVCWLNKQPDYVGTSANNSYAQLWQEGSAYPVFGVGEYADYARGYFPNTVTVIEDRLVLGGFPSRPQSILVSAAPNARMPVSYTDFQIDPLYTETGSAFDAQLATETTDIVTAVKAYQSSLMVFTREQTFRVRGGNNGFSYLNTSVQLVGSKGATNARAVRIAADRLFMVSLDGMYEVQQSAGLSDSYQLVEASANVRGLFTKYSYNQLSTVALYYDGQTRKLYVALPDKVLLVYDSRLSWWSEYTSIYGGFDIIDAVTYQSNTNSQRSRFLLYTYLIDRTYTLRTEGAFYVDYAQDTTTSGTFPVVLPESYIVPLTTDVQYISIPIETTGIDTVDDITVEYRPNGATPWVTLTLGVDYYKTSGRLYLSQVPPNNLGSVRITAKTALNVYNNLAPAAYTVLGNVGTITEWTANDVGYLGYSYFSCYVSPLFSSGVLGAYKRMRHFYGYFNNATFQSHVTSAVFPNASPPLLVGSALIKPSVNVTFSMGDERTGQTQYDMYGVDNLQWDNSLYDTFGTANEVHDYVVLKEPIQGVGYSFQCTVWNWDDGYFGLSGYQIDGKLAGKRYTQRS